MHGVILDYVVRYCPVKDTTEVILILVLSIFMLVVSYKVNVIQDCVIVGLKSPGQSKIWTEKLWSVILIFFLGSIYIILIFNI